MAYSMFIINRTFSFSSIFIKTLCNHAFFVRARMVVCDQTTVVEYHPVGLLKHNVFARRLVFVMAWLVNSV